MAHNSLGGSQVDLLTHTWPWWLTWAPDQQRSLVAEHWLQLHLKTQIHGSHSTDRRQAIGAWALYACIYKFSLLKGMEIPLPILVAGITHDGNYGTLTKRSRREEAERLGRTVNRHLSCWSRVAFHYELVAEFPSQLTRPHASRAELSHPTPSSQL